MVVPLELRKHGRFKNESPLFRERDRKRIFRPAVNQAFLLSKDSTKIVDGVRKKNLWRKIAVVFTPPSITTTTPLNSNNNNSEYRHPCDLPVAPISKLYSSI